MIIYLSIQAVSVLFHNWPYLHKLLTLKISSENLKKVSERGRRRRRGRGRERGRAGRSGKKKKGGGGLEERRGNGGGVTFFTGSNIVQRTVFPCSPTIYIDCGPSTERKPNRLRLQRINYRQSRHYMSSLLYLSNEGYSPLYRVYVYAINSSVHTGRWSFCTNPIELAEG